MVESYEADCDATAPAARPMMAYTTDQLAAATRTAHRIEAILRRNVSGALRCVVTAASACVGAAS